MSGLVVIVYDPRCDRYPSGTPLGFDWFVRQHTFDLMYEPAEPIKDDAPLIVLGQGTSRREIRPSDL